MYQRILTDPLHFPSDMSQEAKSVMVGLLQRDPSKRLGANGGEEIKRHPFFARYIDWNRYDFFFISYARSSAYHHLLCRLLARKIQPPFKPSVVSLLSIINHARLTQHHHQESVLDVANFDTDFTSEEPQDSVVTDSALSETVQDQFRGFTYNPANEHLSESVNYPRVMGWTYSVLLFVSRRQGLTFSRPWYPLGLRLVYPPVFWVAFWFCIIVIIVFAMRSCYTLIQIFFHAKADFKQALYSLCTYMCTIYVWYNIMMMAPSDTRTCEVLYVWTATSIARIRCFSRVDGIWTKAFAIYVCSLGCFGWLRSEGFLVRWRGLSEMGERGK